MEPIIRATTDNSWIFGLILSVILLIGIARVVFNNYFSTLGDLNIFIENQERFIPLTLLVHLALACVIGLTIYPFVDLGFHFMNWSKITTAGIIIGLVLLYFILRFLINTILIYLLGMDEQYKKVLKIRLYFRLFALIGLTILNILLYYSTLDSQIILYIALGIIGLTMILGYVFQFNKKALGNIYASYYFILYLCILEILPVLYVLNHWSR